MSSENHDFEGFCKNLTTVELPSDLWGYQKSFTPSEKFVIFSECQVNKDRTISMRKVVCVNSSLQWHLLIWNKVLDSERFPDFPQHINSTESVSQLLHMADNLNVCKGGPQRTSLQSAEIHCAYWDNFSWRHKKCQLITKPGISVCKMCSRIKNLFAVNLHRQKRVLYRQRLRFFVKTGKISNLSSKRKKIAGKLHACGKKATKLENDVKELMKKIACCDGDSLDAVLGNLSLPAAQVMLIKECVAVGKCASKNGRRYTSDWLLLCLLFYIRNSNAYTFLRENDILPLPSTSTIHRHLSCMDMKCGFDRSFFAVLAKKLSEKTDKQKHGIIMFDEIVVRRSMAVASKQMTYSGFEDFGDGMSSSSDLADHGLVFMFQPFADSWSQPVAVFASSGPTKSVILSGLLVQAIIHLEQAGAYIDAVVCDGASTNRGIWADLGVTGELGSAKPYFIHPLNVNRKIFMFSDVPHLIKCIRNRLLSKRELLHNGQWIKWQYYLNLYDEEMKQPGNLRVCPKLSLAHIQPSNTERMRVKLATQLFSNSVAKGLMFYQERSVRNMNGVEATLSFTQKVNDMFDALNRRTPCEGVRQDSKDIVVMKESINWLNSWEDEVKSGKIHKNAFLTKGTAEGLRVTLLSTVGLAEYLMNSCGFDYVLTAKFNQDPIERFFGIIRQAGGQNDHPAMPTFLQLYRLLSAYSMLKPPKFGNCEILREEEKPCITIQDFKAAFSDTSNSDSNLNKLKVCIDGFVSNADWECDDVIQQDYGLPEVRECIVYYVTGFICRKVSKFSDCATCQEAISNPAVHSSYPAAQLTNLKTRGKLIHPNTHLYTLLLYTEQYFAENAHKTDVYWDTVNHVFENVSLQFPCSEHKTEMIAKILHYYITMRMRQYCKQKNLDLGKQTREKRKLSKLYSK